MQSIKYMPDHNLKEKQLSNLESVLGAAKDFSNDAEIELPPHQINEEIIVLESGHQPNFLPHAGLLKKLFLLNLLRKRFYDQGMKAITLFGFADYNLCTSRLLTQNKLPALTKLGYEKVGFKITGNDIWKRFDCIEKPGERDWKNEMAKIASHYKKYSIPPAMELNLTELMEILKESYGHAKNFPDLNAFFIAKMCNKLLDLDIIFFRYSDLQRKGVFLDEWKSIIFKLKEYNSIYNKTITALGLDVPTCTAGSLPFWYHCKCGAKAALLLKEKQGTGKCRLCSKEHAIRMDKLEESFGDMSPNAAARNIIFSEGIGTHIFISGSGGGLVYGKISDEIARDLGFNIPITVTWKSRDFYMGPAHTAALHQLGRICCILEKGTGEEDINKIIKEKKKRLGEMAAEARENGEKEDVKKYDGQYKNLESSISIIKAVYNTIPSFIDIFVSHGANRTRECWEHALKDAEERQTIDKNVVYGNEIISTYKKLEKIHD